jgi:hypothetical protein
MYPNRPNLHSLMADAGEDLRAVLNNYPALIEGDRPGRYYRLVALNIVPCVVIPDRWQTLSQWEPMPRMYGPMLDGLGTT